jgi:hypothetical protein
MNKALPNKVHFVGTFSTFLIEIIMGTKKSVRDDICQQSSKERKSDIKYHLFVRFFVLISLYKLKKQYYSNNLDKGFRLAYELSNLGEKIFPTFFKARFPSYCENRVKIFSPKYDNSYANRKPLSRLFELYCF